MQANIKNALISTGVVLATIYVLNMFGPTKSIVQRAIQG
jgi:hypothetical protein